MTKPTTLDDLIRQAIRTLPDGYEIHIKAERGAHWCIAVNAGRFPVFIAAAGTPEQQFGKCIARIRNIDKTGVDTLRGVGVTQEILNLLPHLGKEQIQQIHAAAGEFVGASEEEQ